MSGLFFICFVKANAVCGLARAYRTVASEQVARETAAKAVRSVDKRETSSSPWSGLRSPLLLPFDDALTDKPVGLGHGGVDRTCGGATCHSTTTPCNGVIRLYAKSARDESASSMAWRGR